MSTNLAVSSHPVLCDVSLGRIRQWRQAVEKQRTVLYGHTADGMRYAGGWWLGLGALLDRYIDHWRKAVQDPLAMAETNLAERLMFRAHEEAVRWLMRNAELQGVDSTDIEISGRYCRELMGRESRQQYFHRGDAVEPERGYWPACLGPTLLQLPGDVRDSIMRGHAAVSRLDIIMESAERRLAGEAVDATIRPQWIDVQHEASMRSVGPTRMKEITTPDGTVISCGPSEWKLLDFMWDREETTPTEAYRVSRGDHVADYTPDAIKSLLKRANAAILWHRRSLEKVPGSELIRWSGP